MSQTASRQKHMTQIMPLPIRLPSAGEREGVCKEQTIKFADVFTTLTVVAESPFASAAVNNPHILLWSACYLRLLQGESANDGIKQQV